MFLLVDNNEPVFQRFLSKRREKRLYFQTVALSKIAIMYGL